MHCLIGSPDGGTASAPHPAGEYSNLPAGGRPIVGGRTVKAKQPSRHTTQPISSHMNVVGPTTWSSWPR